MISCKNSQSVKCNKMKLFYFPENNEISSNLNTHKVLIDKSLHYMLYMVIVSSPEPDDIRKYETITSINIIKTKNFQIADKWFLHYQFLKPFLHTLKIHNIIVALGLIKDIWILKEKNISYRSKNLRCRINIIMEILVKYKMKILNIWIFRIIVSRVEPLD